MSVRVPLTAVTVKGLKFLDDFGLTDVFSNRSTSMVVPQCPTEKILPVGTKNVLLCIAGY